MFLRISTLAAALSTGMFAQDAATDAFEKRIRPVLAAQCYACHSAALPAPQGGLRLDSTRAIRQGGASGAVIRPGDPERSLLTRAIRHTEKNLKMPPGKPLPAEVVADFENWIRAGAPMPPDEPAGDRRQSTLWSLTKPALPPLPEVRRKDWARNDIDRFVLKRLEDSGLGPSQEADRRTLMRRAAYGLTGLPPSAAETELFVRDSSPQAYERMVDRLLASAAYGERWARHWLDVARYADSVNDSVNAGQRYPWSYTYRDWVIKALNEDLPYDRFVQYQLAADLIPNTERRHLAALGFLSLGREFPKSFPETVDDRIDSVTRGLLGLTVACARCHDHKYDPIPTKDYYSLYSIFSNVRQPKTLPPITPAARVSAKQVMYEDRLARIRKADQEYRARRHAEMVSFFKTQTADYLLAARDAEGMSNPEIEELVRDRQLNHHVLARWRRFLRERGATEPVFRLWRSAAAIPDRDFSAKWPAVRSEAKSDPILEKKLAAERIASLRDLAAVYAAVLGDHDKATPLADPSAEQWRAVMRGSSSPVDVPSEEFELIYTEGDSNNTRAIRVRYNTMLAQFAYDGAAPRAMAVEDLPDPQPAHVFLRGNPANPGAPAPPRFLTCLGGSDEKRFRLGSGRLELARAIATSENPLTARVIVNRVWMHHFGFGLVRTPSDFGFRGDRPTHPELLDYMAVKFVESGWSLKKLHRMILLSAAYRQSSADNEAARKIDPENQLLWRMNRRRLEIEALRDSMLAASGRLDPAAGGPPFALMAEPSTPRRSVYGFIERGRVPAFLTAFDFASPDQHAPMRFVTTVPQQALFLLNSPFVAEQARHAVSRPDVRAATRPEDRIGHLYRAIFGRAPEKWEVDAGLRFVSSGESGAPALEASPWTYGIGEFRAETGRVESFTPFPTFAQDRWQGGAALPAARFGRSVLTATGGEPGEQKIEAVIRRWVSPVSGKLNIEGTLRHAQPAVPYGDGVRGRVVSSRHGEVASWSVNGSTAETRLNGIAVEKGDRLDFIVDAKTDIENDSFFWAPVIRMGERSWSAKDDFAGPPPEPLGVWARYAQVLFETNEFAFVD